ncbi:OLC1v1021261C1 [Oldenlandia corymbosa var. corymbosa]|uniref:OLC1v1021261C1 n=1 Tax=Oldenlandia corymbosa var. corymbosa TaxID=529605 RepID=A0AAV1BXH4_OLDCO|nr:OLC1v1021261C1 [Oldenlandia corymbosa var. corymbosa]
MSSMGKTSVVSLCIYPLAYDYTGKPFIPTKPLILPKSLSSETSVSSLARGDFRNSVSTKASILSVNRTGKDCSFDCNVEIGKFCEVGNLQKAMELLCRSGNLGLVDVPTCCCILQLCADLKSLDNGRKVHSFLNTAGIEINGVLGSKLVFMYVSCGDLVEGRRVFDKIDSENVFLWNLLMNAYAKMGSFQDSVLLFYKMLETGVQANSYTFSCILKCFAALRSRREGEEVHAYLLKLGFGSCTTVVNSLITFYFKCRRIEHGQKLFDKMCERDIISWNSMMSGYVVNGLAQKGIKTFNEILRQGVGVDLSTMVVVLAACADVGSIWLSKAIHAYAMKAGFATKMDFDNTIMDVYSKCGDIGGAVCIFQNMVEKDIVSWTSMIAGYGREGMSNEAFELFRTLRKRGINPDVFVVTSILHACACSGSLENGLKVHEYIKENNMESNLVVSNALMNMYSKCGSMENAENVFSRMTTRDIVSWNTMIGGYSKNGLPSEALNMFIRMQLQFRPDDVSVTCILPACASLGALERGREVHCYLLKNELSSDLLVANALVDMYVKCGALATAKLLFDKIVLKDLFSWTIMIAGFGMHGFGREAIATFNEMRQAGIEPDETSFISILYACSHSGLFDEGWKFFNLMRNEFHIQPKLDHYACIVDLLARAGKLSMAYKFIKNMPLEPDATIWTVLLSGCRMHHDVRLAEKVADHVFELEPENTHHYLLLANIYAEAEKWNEVQQLRQRMIKRGLKKNVGCSWIGMKGEVYIFVSSRTNHPEARNITLLLKDLSKEMKEQGDASRKKYALINTEEKQKQFALCGHSEKLAMGFGILRSPPGKAIRVTKNLRVCGECHEMGKFMSKKFGKEILLRDSNRFHHFKDGTCSCRGYW